MTTQNFSTFLIYKASDAGRKVYIDPELIVTFAEYVDPTTDAGGKIANDIFHKLSSTAEGSDAGQEQGKSNSFFMDIGEFTGHCVRVFYKIIQDYPGGMSKGPGVYIYNLRGFAHNNNNVGTGLYHMQHTDKGWNGTPSSKQELKNKTLRIGSSQDEKGIFALDKLSKLMLEGAGQASFKTDFDLYHSPLAVVEYGKDFTTPVARKVTQPSELAKVLESTATIYEWSDSLRHEKYTVYVYGQSAKLLADALRLVDNQPQLLKKFEFQLLAPHIPFSLVKTLAESLGATAVLDGNVQSGLSKRYQMLDEKSLIESDIAVFKKFEGQITNRPNSRFFDLWQCMKTTTHLLT